MANELLDSVIVRRGQGDYNLKIDITTGTAKLQYSVDNEAFTDIEGSTQTANAGVSITLPKCRLNAVLTGDARMYLTDIT